MVREYDSMPEHYISNYEKYNSDGDAKLEDFIVKTDVLDSKAGISLINNDVAQNFLLEHIKDENLNEQLNKVMGYTKKYELGLKTMETCVNSKSILRLQKDLLSEDKESYINLEINKESSLEKNSQKTPLTGRDSSDIYYINKYENDANSVDIKLEDFTVQAGDFLDSKGGISLISNSNITQNMALENIQIENLNEQLEIGNAKSCKFQLQKIETVKLEMLVQSDNVQILYRDPLEDDESHLKLKVNEELILNTNAIHSTPRKDNGDLLCKKCNKTFACKYYYKFHIRTHARNTPCICDICEKVFVKPCLLKRHIVAHSESRPYSCKICMKGFKRKNAVRQHQRIHFYRQRFPCDQCDKSFQSENKLKTHKVYHKIDDTVSNILYSTP